MRKRSLISGFLAGVLLCGVVALGFALNSTDPRDELVAVSWGSHTNNAQLWIYQVQVSAKESAKKGELDVSARVCIGGGSYFHDLGTIGTASNMGDAFNRFGVINWFPDSLAIGGSDGVKATLERTALQRHR